MGNKPIFNPNIHHRKSIRLKGYDYSQEGLYFITICCQNRACLFGEIINGEMILNKSGQIANDCWLEIPQHFPNVVLHEHIIMPNHIHGIIEIKTKTVGAENFPPNNDGKIPLENFPPNNDGRIPSENFLPNDDGNRSNDDNYSNVVNRANDNSPLRGPSKTIGSIVRGYKIGVTNWIRQNTTVYDVWQRNYYENIIRNEQSYIRISQYIINNSTKWTDDKFYK